MTRQQRADFIAETVSSGSSRSYPAVKLRFYDAFEVFSGRCTDMAVFETADLRAYTFLIDALRDTPFFGLPHFEVLDVIPAYREQLSGVRRGGGRCGSRGA